MSTKKKNKTKRRNAKTSFFSILIKAIKDAYHHYKNEMNRKVQEHKLLSSKSDWTMLEQFIQDINENPNLKIDITLNDLTKINLYCYKEEKSQRDFDLLNNVRRVGPEL